jgi:hypothetical protein
MLEKELAFFQQNKAAFLQHHANQFVVIHGTDLLGAYSTAELAYEAGLQKVGNVPILIKQVLAVENADSIPAYSFGLLSA